MAAWKTTEQDEIRNTFARNLRRLMVADNISQKELADKMQAGPSSVSAWVNGGKLPRTETIQKLADLFDVDVAELLSESTTTTIAIRNAKKTNHTNEAPVSITGTISVEDIALAQQISKLDSTTKRLIMYLLKFQEAEENENSR